MDNPIPEDYEPFGDEWEKEMKKFDKNQLISIYKESRQKILRYEKREEHFKNIYDKANEILAVIGAEGVVDSREAVSQNLMDALFDFDGGEWHTEKMFPSKFSNDSTQTDTAT